MKIKYSEEQLACADWEEISQQGDLSDEFIEQYADKLNWTALCYNQIISENILRKFKDKVNWETVCGGQILSLEFIREMADYVDWYEISSQWQNMDEDFLREFSDKIDWRIAVHCYLPEKFVLETRDRHKWEGPSRDCDLSKEVIDRFAFQLDWNSVCFKQRLSEETMEKWKDLVDWKVALKYQKMCSKFKEEHLKYLRAKEDE